MDAIYSTGVLVGLVLTLVCMSYMFYLEVKDIYKDYTGPASSFSEVVKDVRGHGYDFDWLPTILALGFFTSVLWPFILVLVIPTIMITGLSHIAGWVIHKVMSKNR